MNKPALCQECSRSEWETGGLHFLSFLVWALASGHTVGQLAFFGGISSQATLLVSENKPQISLECLHVCSAASELKGEVRHFLLSSPESDEEKPTPLVFLYVQCEAACRTQTGKSTSKVNLFRFHSLLTFRDSCMWIFLPCAELS